jgi:hypothetical protein
MSENRKTTGVSFEGDKYDVAAINHLAGELGITTGKLVADAVQKVYGTELAPLVSFFRNRASQKSHSTSEKAEAEHA